MLLFACVAIGGLLVVWGVPRLYVLIEQAFRRG